RAGTDLLRYRSPLFRSWRARARARGPRAVQVIELGGVAPAHVVGAVALAHDLVVADAVAAVGLDLVVLRQILEHAARDPRVDDIGLLGLGSAVGGEIL